MLKSRNFLGAVATALVLAIPAQAEEMTLDSVVASVDGTDITLGHMLMVRALLPEQYQQMPADALWDGILDQLIQQQVLAANEDAKETPRVRIAMENERRSQMASVVIAALAKEAVTEEAVVAAYEAEYANVEPGMEYNAAHILVASKADAEALIQQLNGGADFAELAREKSTGPSGPNGGSLGWFSKGMMVPAFQEAVEGLEPGGISAPVSTQFGWHVIKLSETRSQEAPALDSVRPALETQIRQNAVSEKINSLVEAANVTRTMKEDVDTSVLSNLELLED